MQTTPQTPFRPPMPTAPNAFVVLLNALRQSVKYRLPRHQRHDRRHDQRAAAALHKRVSGGLLCLAILACGSDTTGPAPLDLGTAYWTLRLNHHAINMALPPSYNTVQLTAAPLTLAGTPVPDAGRAQYSTTDSTVAVDSLGRLTARYATLGQPAQVIASLTVQGFTLTDTAFVQVDSFPRALPLTTFSIHPQGTTCRQSAFDAQFSLPVYAIDAARDTLRNRHVTDVLVYYASSDRTIATIDRSYGGVIGYGPGAVTFTATALIDGVAQKDTLLYTLDPSHLVTVTTAIQQGAGGVAPTLRFTPATVTVGAGWHVNLANPTLDTVDIAFTDSTRGVNGTVVGSYAYSDTAHTGPLYPGTLGEVFFDAGTYDYHSERFGQSGTIRVQCGYK